MVACPKCGAEVAKGKYCCPFCGAVVGKVGVAAEAEPEPRERPDMPIESEYYLTANIPSCKRGSVLWFVPGFLLPILGLALFIIWRFNKPRASTAAGLGAFISLIVSIGTIFAAAALMRVS